MDSEQEAFEIIRPKLLQLAAEEAERMKADPTLLDDAEDLTAKQTGE